MDGFLWFVITILMAGVGLVGVRVYENGKKLDAILQQIERSEEHTSELQSQR